MASSRRIRVIRCCSKVLLRMLFFLAGVFLDLKKAFDTVDHFILLHILYHHKITDIINDWSSSYLSNRFQATHTDSYISNKSNIYCDVPRGSFLGKLLSLININDRHMLWYLFADSTSFVRAKVWDHSSLWLTAS